MVPAVVPATKLAPPPMPPAASAAFAAALGRHKCESDFCDAVLAHLRDGGPHVDVAADLFRVHHALALPEVLAYVERHVWPDEARAAFFLAGPYERVLARISAGELGVTAQDRVVQLTFFDALLDHGLDPARVACRAVPCLAAFALALSDVEPLCCFLGRLLQSPRSRPLATDAALFRCLATCASRVPTAVRPVATAALVCGVDHACVEPVVEAVAARYSGDVGGPPLALLEAAAARAEWRPRLAALALSLARRRAWKREHGRLAANLLAGASVALVLRMHHAGTLRDFVGAAAHYARGKGHDSRAWREAREHLRRHWPAAVGDAAADAVTQHECPITLQPMRRPAVASDGHTYERDALLAHLAADPRAVSPVTREPLELTVYENYALR